MDVSQQLGVMLGKVSLAVAVLAYYPSVAPFTGAIFFSVFAFAGAAIAAVCGAFRLAAMTFYTVVATFLVSPITEGIIPGAHLGFAFIGLLAFGVVMASAVYRDYRTSGAPDRPEPGNRERGYE